MFQHGEAKVSTENKPNRYGTEPPEGEGPGAQTHGAGRGVSAGGLTRQQESAQPA